MRPWRSIARNGFQPAQGAGGDAAEKSLSVSAYRPHLAIFPTIASQPIHARTP